METVRIIKVNQLTEDEARDEYPSIFFTFMNEFPSIPNSRIAVLVSIAVGICSVCHEQATPCNCWNDE